MDYDALRALLFNWIHVGPFRTFEEYCAQPHISIGVLGTHP